MKKYVLATVAMCILVMLLASTVPGALASVYVDPDAFGAVLESNTDISWQWQWTNGNDGRFIIMETAILEGHAYEIDIEGFDDRVSRVSFYGWFNDLRMLDGGLFSDGLDAYNDCVRTCESFLPDDWEVETVFSAYDIYQTLPEGESWVESDLENWGLLSASPGRLAIRHLREGCTVEAELMSNGTIWFSVVF